MIACHPKLLSLFSKLELWHLCKSMLPSAKGLSIYVSVESSSSYKRHQLESTSVIFMLCFWLILSMTMTGSSLLWITMFSQPLIFESALHLCSAVSERASEIPPIHIASWLFWLKCWYLKLIIICSLADYAIDISLPWDLCVISYVVNLWSWWNSSYELDIVATTRSNRVCQSFSFSLSLSTELLEDKQGFKLGGVDTSPSYLLF